jgi:hypothetical protein
LQRHPPIFHRGYSEKPDTLGNAQIYTIQIGSDFIQF